MTFREITQNTLKRIDAELQGAEQFASLTPNPSTAALQNRYFVEACFIEQYFTKKYGEAKITNIHVHISSESCDDLSQFLLQFQPDDVTLPEHGLSVAIDIKDLSGETTDTLQMLYFVSDDLSYYISFFMTHGLVVIDKDDNLVYLRAVNHDPFTEWYTNELANDLEDEEGNFIFPGDPVQI